MKESVGRPSQNLRKWLAGHIAACRPGTRLPAPAKLSKQWPVSAITVKRIYKEFSQQGMLQTVQGKGTFVPFEKQPAAADISPRKNSAEEIASLVLHSIRNGTYKIRQTLPSVKFLSLHYRVAPATITKAYKSLIARGLIYKVGKNFIVGSGSEGIQTPAGKKIVFFVQTNAADLYRDTLPGADRWMSQAFRKLEHELLTSGYTLQYCRYREFEQQCRAWIRSRHAPRGLMLHAVGNGMLRSLLPAMKRLRKKHDTAMLLDWQKGDYRIIPRTVKSFSRGNIQTALVRLLTRRIALKGYTMVRFYYDEQTMPYAWILRSLRIWTELQGCAPGTRFEIIANVKNPKSFYEHARNLDTPQYLRTYLGKYGRHSYKGLEEFARCDSRFARFFHEPSMRVVNIFLHDNMALGACEYACQKGLRIPRDFGIISLENNPEYYHHQISCCIPDWENIGYIMAHSLIGDIPLEKSRKGFIRMPALFLDRGSC